ncbi:hypothetical protein [Mucilaginibacter psychrotolerans]|uniref:Uncharacterized protein n=1 Tax=Mucilaginibacter psychrotolerans TaxID=1524096 RepID=A0A4Y8SM55_9SPHI|nr:hypothetical protein [Mucilaginibacter psychrotolerans]TFF40139.1 hypothetical protein E2R66_02480 [Mucilaginibacter psychrotolerans]
MIEVFKTDVDDWSRSRMLMGLIAARFSVCRINFDLEDCDRVLRVEGDTFCPRGIIELLQQNGCHCEILS